MPPKKRQAPTVPGTGVMLAPPDVMDELIPYLALGFAMEETKGTSNLCGLFALAGSLRAARNLTETIDDFDHVTPKYLWEVTKSAEYEKLIDDRVFELFGAGGDVDLMLEERQQLLAPNFLSSAQLDMILTVVNKRLGTSYRLGVITARGVGERQRKVNGKPVPLPMMTSRRNANTIQQYEMETFAIEASTQIFNKFDGESGPVVFVHNVNAANQLVPGIDHWQSFGLHCSNDGVEEVLSWGLDPRINAAVDRGLYIAEADVEEDKDDWNLGALQGQFLYQQPFPKNGSEEQKVLQTSSNHIYARNCVVTQSPRLQKDRSLNEGQVTLDDLRKIGKVDAKIIIDEEAGPLVDLRMYIAGHPDPKEGEETYKFKRNEYYEKGSVVLDLRDDQKTGDAVVRFQNEVERALSRFVLEPVKRPFLIGKIVRPLTKKAADKAARDKYHQKVSDLRNIASARDIDITGATKADLMDLLVSDDLERDEESKQLILYRTGESDDPIDWPTATLVRVKGEPSCNGLVKIITLMGRQASWPMDTLVIEPEAWRIRIPLDTEEESVENPSAAVGTLTKTEAGEDIVKVTKMDGSKVVTPSRPGESSSTSTSARSKSGNDEIDQHLAGGHRKDTQTGEIHARPSNSFFAKWFTSMKGTDTSDATASESSQQEGILNELAKNVALVKKSQAQKTTAADRFIAERDRIKAQLETAAETHRGSQTNSGSQANSEAKTKSESPTSSKSRQSSEYQASSGSQQSSVSLVSSESQEASDSEPTPPPNKRPKKTTAAKRPPKTPAGAGKQTIKNAAKAAVTKPTRKTLAGPSKQTAKKAAKREAEEEPEGDNKVTKKAKRNTKKKE